MANIVKTESGIDLLQRLSVRPKLLGFQTKIFGNGGLQPGDVIEISEKNTGLKNTLLTQWIAELILPVVWKGMAIGGIGVGVVFLSTDHHFSPLHLISVLEKRLKRALRQSHQLAQGSASTLIKEITKDSLKRLSIYESFNKTELLFNFCSVKTFILSHQQTSVVVIDSLSAYYWEDRLSSSFQSLEKYCHSLLGCLIDKLKQTNITIIYTVQRFLRDRDPTDKEVDTSLAPPHYVYSVSLEHQNEFIMHVEDRRNATKVSKKLHISKGEIISD